MTGQAENVSDRRSGSSAELAALIDDLAARMQAGEVIDLEAVLGEHPDHAQELRQLLPALQLLADVASAGGSGQPLGGGPRLGELGDFRLIREVGRGGMGIVYEAEQLSLNRKVALKVLPFAATMDPKQLLRFRNEAMAAASLRHDHIVHVYGVGCERGVHFYAMEFIDGQTLAQIIHSMASGGRKPPECKTPDFAPGPFAPGSPVRETVAALTTQPGGVRGREFYRSAARLIADAADALEHAHQLGVVHRDVKPGNLMVDAAGKLWVADFGLARFGPDAGLTMSGDLLGTLRYMAPEQALAKHGLVDHRVDIYGLGCSLYELLTGRPAIDGEDRQEILRRIAFEEPAAPRKLDRSVPAELETIALKCLAKEPKERYAAAGELAEDLRRFLDDKPVKAKPPTTGQRLRKWASRHRSVVATSALFFVLASLALTAGSVVLWQEKEHTQKALRQAETSFDKAREVVDEMYTRVAEEWLQDEPQMSEVQRDFLQKALDFYEAFADDAGRGETLQLDRAKAYRRVGTIQISLGQHEAAREAFIRATALLEGRPARRGDEDSELAAAYAGRAVSVSDGNQQAGAERDLRRALNLLGTLPSDYAAKPDQRFTAAKYQANLGGVLARAGRSSESIAVLQPCVGTLRQLAGEFPKEPKYQSMLGNTLSNLAVAQARGGDLLAARDTIEQAIRYQEVAVRLNPRPVGQRNGLRNHYATLASVLRDLGALAEAATASRQALALAQKLVDDFPARPDYQLLVLDSCFELAQALVQTDRAEDFDEAERTAKRAITVADLIQRQFPESLVGPDRAQIAAAHAQLGFIYDGRGNLGDAETQFRQALAIYPNAKHVNNLFWALARGKGPGRNDPAELLRLARTATEQDPKLSQGWAALALAQTRVGNWVAARGALDKSLDVKPELNTPAYFLMALILCRTGDPGQGRAWFDRATATMDRHAPNDACLTFLKSEAAAALRGKNEAAEVAPREDKP